MPKPEQTPLTDEQLQQAARLVQGWRRPLILTHVRPDGDAVGSALAMRSVLAGLGQTPVAPLDGGMPGRYAWLADRDPPPAWPIGPIEQLEADHDGILIVDTCSWAQLEPVADFLRASRLPRVIVDHHATRDDLTGQASTALYLLDPTAASCCGVLHRWCRSAGWAIDACAAEALFIGLTTDTGWFRFPNTDPATLAAAADLLAVGELAIDVLYTRVYECWRAARLRLKAAVLGTLQLHADGRIATTRLTQAMLADAGAEPADADELVNEPMSVHAVVASVLFSEQTDGRVRVNFRSKSPAVCGCNLDVAALAKSFGGGGHQRAAGARITGTLADAEAQILPALLAAWDAVRAG